MSNGIAATETAFQSQGSAIRENETYLDSINGKISQLGASFQKLSADTLDSGFVKFLLDFARMSLDLIDNVGILTIGILALTLILGAKGKFGTGIIGISSLIDKFVISMGMGTAAATTFSATLSVLFPVALIIGAVVALNEYNKSIDKTIQNQRDTIEVSNKNIDNYEQEISKLNILQKSLADARGNKESLLSISSQLNSVISETPGLINGEADAYDIAKQKLIDYRIELENKIKADKTAKAAAQSELYNTNSIDNRFTLDRLPNAGLRVDLKEAVSALDLYGDFPDLASDELKAKLKKFVEEQIQIAQSVFVEYVNQSLPDAASRAAATNFITELVYGGFSLDQIDVQLEELIPSIKEINSLKNELSTAKANGTPTDEIVSRFIALIDELKVKFPYMNEYFDTFTGNFVSVASGTRIANDEIIDYAKSVEKSKEALDNLIKSNKTLNAAFKEQEENGSLSAETILSVMQAGYGAALQIDAETGVVKLQATAYRDLTRAMMDTEIAKLKLAKAGLESDKSKNNPYTWISGINNLTEDERKSLSDVNNQIAAYEEITKNIDSIIAGTYGDNSKSSSAKSSSSDPYKDMVESKIDDIKYLSDMGQMTQVEYLNELDALNQKYYANQTKYVEEFRRLNVEVYKGNLQLADEAAKDAEKRAEEDKKIAEDRIKTDQDAIDRRIQNVSDSYDKHKDENKLVSDLESILKLVNISEEQRLKIIKQIAEIRKTEYSETLADIENENFLLEKKSGTEQKQIDNYRRMQTIAHDEAVKLRQQGFSESSDEIQSLIKLWWTYEDNIKGILKNLNDTITDNLKASLTEQSDALQEHINSLQEEQSNLEKTVSYAVSIIDEQISKLEKEKSLLQENNDERDREIERIKLVDSLTSARNNKNVRVYSESAGWQWQENSKTVSEAENALSEFDQKEKLRKELSAIDDRIAAWNDYKKAWQSISSDYENSQNELIAKEILGASAEADILNQRTAAVTAFGARYVSVLNDIKTAQDELTTIQEQISNVESGGSTTGGGSSKVSPIAYSGTKDYQLEINSILQKMESATPEEKKSSSFATYMETLGALESQRNSKIKSEKLPYEQTSLYGGQKFASGTDSVPYTGISLVGERGEELRVLNAGDSILKADVTKNLKNFGSDPLGYLTNKYNQISQSIFNKNTKNGDTILQIANITLPGVSDAPSLIRGLEIIAKNHSPK